ncbi:FecR family protein [Terrimonas rubra]|uniref:FecR family protein n=1 Tax=Terrimonas rubra TaxID=1035890 RepID=A0ABW6A3F8_9BACT
MTPEAFKQALTRYQAGTASPLETAYVERWYESLPDATGIPDAEMEIIGERVYSKIINGIKPAPRRYIFLLRPLLKVAAVLLVLLGGFFLYNRSLSPGKKAPEVFITPGSEKAVLQLADGTLILLDSAGTGNLATDGGTQIVKLADGTVAYQDAGAVPNGLVAYNELQIPAGGFYKLQLPDKSMVWLNSVSSIRYPTKFTGKERRVIVKGEAYFEVAHNKLQPFIVEVAGKQEVTVLGTHFNISAYADEAVIKTTLLQGSVKVKAAGMDKQTRLSPGQQSIWQARAGITTRNGVDIEQAVAWKDGYFQFDETETTEIMRQLSRWYRTEMVVDPPLKGQTFSGKIPRTDNIEKILNIFERTGSIRYTIDGNTIKIFRKR